MRKISGIRIYPLEDFQVGYYDEPVASLRKMITDLITSARPTNSQGLLIPAKLVIFFFKKSRPNLDGPLFHSIINGAGR